VKNNPTNGIDPLGLYIQCGEGVDGCTICAEYDDDTEELIGIVSGTVRTIAATFPA
jgi:hypothetical protein